jgi:hypothetical protein
MHQLYHTWIHHLHCSSLPPSLSIHGIVTTRYHCSYMHMHTFFFALYSPSYSFATFPLPLVSTLPTGQDLFQLPVHQSCRREKIKRKTWHFCLFEIKVAIQGVSLWYFHLYKCYTNWFISSNCLHSVSSFLMLDTAGLKCMYSFCIESISPIVKFLLSFFCPTPPVHDLSLVWTVFHTIAAFVIGLCSMWLLAFWTWLFHLRWCFTILTIYCKWQNFILLCGWIKPHCI